METQEEVKAKAEELLTHLPSGWVYFTFEIETDCDEDVWQFVLKKGPVTLFPKENATKWVCRIGSKQGETSGPWETKQECVTMKGAMEQEAIALQKFTQLCINLCVNAGKAFEGCDND